jgi:hypothetical protein
MRINLVRRLMSLGVAAVAAATGLAAQPVPAAAPAAGQLFAVSGVSRVVTLDTASGAQTTVADLSSLTPSRGIDGLVADQGSTMLYGAVSYCICGKGGGAPVSQVLTVDSQSHIVQLSPFMTAPVGGAIAFDQSTRALWAITACGSCAGAPILKVDPLTGAETAVATIPGQDAGFSFYASVALAPAAHALYVTYSLQGAPNQLFTLNTATGMLTAGPAFNHLLSGVVYDVSAGALFGITTSVPQQLVRIDPSTDVETPIHTFDTGHLLRRPTIDSASHTVFAIADDVPSSGAVHIWSINDQTGVATISAAITTPLGSLAFQPAQITPESIKAVVQSALGSGAITNAGVAAALLTKLDEAAAARSRGQCNTSGNVYQAFINEVNAQSGKAIASATASQLVSEAQFLIANCP